MGNWPVLAALLLWGVSLLNSFFPLMMAQRRLRALSLAELTAQCPGLGWLRWGYPAFYIGTGLIFVAALLWAREGLHGMSDAKSGFVIGAVLCMFPLVAGVLALTTGVYRAMSGEGFTRGYYRVEGSPLSWMPRAQIGAAIATAGVCWAGLVAL